ncbi:MAG: nitrous oxide reductase family maturation protein NosD, partial [Promethearchaeota archaeon]
YTIYNDVGMPIANDTKPIYENPIHNADKIYIDDTGVSALNWSQTELVKWWCEGSGIESDPYIIEDLIIDGLRAGSCILIGNSSVYFEINNCTVYNCSESLFATDSAGIRLINVNNSRIIENNCSYNYGVGIVLFNCNNNNLSNNIANNNRGSINNGIHIAGTLVGSENNTVSQNIANNNTGSGFEASGCYNITFYGNTAKNNTISGISLSASDKSHIINNIIVNNSYNGISLGVGTSNNTILLNTIIDNLGRGILLQDSFDNDIVNNTISSNEYGGIAIAASTFGSLNNNVSRNLISYNDGFGIYIDKNSNNSLIFNNTFIGNQYHAFDNGTNNHWNSSIIGNYWDNYTGEDLIAPYGIGDTPYNIPGVAGSKDYLPINNGTLPTPGPTPPPSDGDDDDDDDDGKDEFDIVEFLTSPTGLSIIGGSVAVVAIIIIIKIKASGKSRVKEIKRIESLRSE